MPNLTLTIEDTSPLLVYSNEWAQGSSKTDNLIESYSDSSYTCTSSNAASVVFVFTGTNIDFFGSKRSTHGFYQVSVDSTVYTPVNGNSSDPVFQTSLFSSITLPNKVHTAQLSNADSGTTVDLDFVTWTTPIGGGDEELVVNTFQDTDLSFKYTPANAWTTNPSNLGSFAGGSGHVSSQAGSTIQFTFQGDAVSLFGPVGPSGAPYSASINVGNGLPNNYTTNKTFFRSNMMLFHANSLGPGSHTVTLTVLGGHNASSLAVDYAEVYTTPSLGGQRLALVSTNSLSTVNIVGITLAGVIAMFAVIGICIWGILCYIRRKHNRSFFYGFAQIKEGDEKDPAIRPYTYTTLPEGSLPLGQRSVPQTLTTPNTGQWPQSAGGESLRPLINQTQHQASSSNPLAQEIMIPPLGSEKYRPDRVPQIQPVPPHGSKPLRNNPASRGAAAHSISTVSEESGSDDRHLRIITELEEPSAPPPEYSQQAADGTHSTRQSARHSVIPTTAASSFYAREAFHGM